MNKKPVEDITTVTDPEDVEAHLLRLALEQDPDVEGKL